MRRWSGKRDSNSQPSAWKADALAIELFPHVRRSSPTEICLLQPVQIYVVVGEGLEPSKSLTTDLQSVPFGQLGNPTTGAGDGT